MSVLKKGVLGLLMKVIESNCVDSACKWLKLRPIFIEYQGNSDDGYQAFGGIETNKSAAKTLIMHPNHLSKDLGWKDV